MLSVDIFGFVSQAVSTTVAVVALLLSFRAERRNHERFQVQLELTRRIALANIKPVLTRTASDHVDSSCVELTNHGAGTAIITDLKLRKGDRTATYLPDLIDSGYDFDWDSSWDIADQTFYVAPHSSEPLLAISVDSLLGQGFDKATAAKIIKRINRQVDDVTIVVTYTDVLGNRIEENKNLTATGSAG